MRGNRRMRNIISRDGVRSLHGIFVGGGVKEGNKSLHRAACSWKAKCRNGSAHCTVKGNQNASKISHLSFGSRDVGSPEFHVHKHSRF